MARWLWHPSTISAIFVSFLVFSALAWLRGSLASLGGTGYASILAVGLIAGALATIGGLIGYVLGSRRADNTQIEPTYGLSVTGMRRWIGPSLFTCAILTGPFMIASFWAGTVHYPLWRFLLFVSVGKVIKLTGFAFAAYYSIPLLLGPLG